MAVAAAALPAPAPDKVGGIPKGHKQTEFGVIPADWSVTTVGAEFTVQLGKMLDAEKNIGVSKPFLGNRAVQWGRIDLEGIGTIKLTPSDLLRFRLRKGDLLVCEGGEVGRAAIWNEPLGECYYQKALHRLRAKRDYDATLMLNVLHWLSARGFLTNFITQTSIAHLPKDKFEVVPIPLPPSSEERRALAEALSDADALIESLESLIAKKRVIKQGAMQELLTGKRRLPGFTKEWVDKEIWEIAEVDSDSLAAGSDPNYLFHYISLVD
jgi:type I restriction enzyme S subunit